MLRLHRTLSLMGRKRKRIPASLVVGASCKATDSMMPNLNRGLSSSICRAPEKGRLKLNFDGSSATDCSSIEGVYRDHKANFVLGYAQRIHRVTSSVAELLALKRGLELAVNNGWRDISIEGDCKCAVDAIASRARVRAKNDQEQYKEIAEILAQLGKTTVSHVLRKGNTAADGFAKLGHKAVVQRLWRDVPPVEVLQYLVRDAEGK